MSSAQAETAEGPYRGSKCVAGPDPWWGRATIRRVNEDGTFTIDPDEKRSRLMPYWYGVTPSEVSFNDAGRWPAALARLTGGAGRLSEPDFVRALSLLGFQAADERVHRFWVETCAKRFGIGEAQAAGASLDAEQAYALCLAAGVSAKRLDEALAAGGPERPYYTFYWNLTRMGGRDPAEVRRPVTLDDALAAVGAAGRETDGDAAARLRSFEAAHGIRLPEALKTFFGRRGVGDLIRHSHPNNPDPVTAEREGWALRRDVRGRGVDADFAVTVMLPHQGDHEWAAVFNDGDPDARVYVRWEQEEVESGDVWRLTAPTVGMFFWDLAQTGLAWYRETGFKGGPPTRETDIGLAVGR